MVKGHTYSEQLFESEAFRHFVNTFLNKESGITKGCEITQTSNTIEIGQGFFVIMGGLLEEDTGTSMSVPTEAGYYRLVYEIDLSKVNTEAEFNQGSYKFVKGVGAYSNLTQEDLDNDGNVYQFEFCQFRVTESGIQDFIDKRTFLDFDNIYEEIRKRISAIEEGEFLNEKVKTKIITGEEVVTNEFINEKQVYCKRIYIPSLPNNNSIEVDIGLNATNINLVKLQGIMKNLNTNEQYPLPFVYNEETNPVFMWLHGEKLIIGTGIDRSYYSANIDLYYTKN